MACPSSVSVPPWPEVPTGVRTCPPLPSDTFSARLPAQEAPSGNAIPGRYYQGASMTG